MSKALTDLLKIDHSAIKKHIKSVEAACAKDDLNKIRQSFDVMMSLILAHAKSEERVLYKKFEDADFEGSTKKLEALTLEAKEEHNLVEHLLQQMDGSEVDEKWKAKLAVVKELLEHHIEEEEGDYFPKVEKRMTKDDLVDLGAIYLSEKDTFLENDDYMGPLPSKSSSPSKREKKSPSEIFH